MRRENNQGAILVVVLLWMSIVSLTVLSAMDNAVVAQQMDHVFHDYFLTFNQTEMGIVNAANYFTDGVTTGSFEMNKHVTINVRAIAKLDARWSRCYRVSSKACDRLACSSIKVVYCFDAQGLKHFIYWQG